LHTLVANEKFISVFAGAFRKLDSPSHHIGRTSCRLENCRATASLILHRSR